MIILIYLILPIVFSWFQVLLSKTVSDHCYFFKDLNGRVHLYRAFSSYYREPLFQESRGTGGVRTLILP